MKYLVLLILFVLLPLTGIFRSWYLGTLEPLIGHTQSIPYRHQSMIQCTCFLGHFAHDKAMSFQHSCTLFRGAFARDESL